ncbi:subtilase-type protease inhibitor [Streptomyces melanosporofaciens]|uniref:Probable subtilase-type protease inhibitor n=1 Tax=Streptomyces violaceusniger (strain Tu 4113) TaxID=653045 RepID=G2NVV0_STRV4|nr:subtilase-type protease inhibitor [Streptomyces violaceusniger]AEM86191.1 subtilase-type protease inhibitor [Streptomyces violaceusniger Tu 4113]
MRKTTGAIGLGAALAVSAVLGIGTSGTASAQPAKPQSLYPPSALVLTVGWGADAATTEVQRAVTLSCRPTATGTHPAPAKACAELRSVGGTFGQLRTGAEPGRVCTKEWHPITVTAEGIWDGRRVSYEHTFANNCFKSAAPTMVFEF